MLPKRIFGVVLIAIGAYLFVQLIPALPMLFEHSNTAREARAPWAMCAIGLMLLMGGLVLTFRPEWTKGM